MCAVVTSLFFSLSHIFFTSSFERSNGHHHHHHHQKEKDSESDSKEDSREGGRLSSQDKFRRTVLKQVQAIRQQLPDVKIDYSELIPGYTELSCETRAEKIEARMNVLKVQYRQRVEDLRKLFKQTD